MPPLRYHIVESGIHRGGYPVLCNFRFMKRYGIIYKLHRNLGKAKARILCEDKLAAFFVVAVGRSNIGDQTSRQLLSLLPSEGLCGVRRSPSPSTTQPPPPPPPTSPHRLNLRTIISLIPDDPTQDLKDFCAHENIDIMYIQSEKFKVCVLMTK